MWDYDKLFAEGNVIGFYVGLVKDFTIKAIDEYQNKILHECYKNNSLSYCPDYCSKENETRIQYIIRLDEHGNVIEKLFDREKDMPKPMPKLKTGMFIRVIDNQSMGKTTLGYVDTINNNIVYQDGTYNEINYLRKLKGIVDIVEIYSEKSLCFDLCNKNNIIWRAPEYQKYLDSQTK